MVRKGKKIVPTVAPGQYTYIRGALKMTTYYIKVNDPQPYKPAYYFIAHGVAVCGSNW
jgi:hypothetical protein